MSDARNTPNAGLGRRAEALAETARWATRVIVASAGQRRQTRRNNLRLARIENRRIAERERLKAELQALAGQHYLGSFSYPRVKAIKARLEEIMTDAERTRRRDAKQAQVIAQARAA